MFLDQFPQEESLLVHRPKALITRYKGYDVFVKSNNTTEDGKKFDTVVLELQLMLKDLQEVV